MIGSCSFINPRDCRKSLVLHVEINPIISKSGTIKGLMLVRFNHTLVDDNFLYHLQSVHDSFKIVKDDRSADKKASKSNHQSFYPNLQDLHP